MAVGSGVLRGDLSERVSHVGTYELCFLGRGSSRCREREMGGCWTCWRSSSKEIHLTGDW